MNPKPHTPRVPGLVLTRRPGEAIIIGDHLADIHFVSVRMAMVELRVDTEHAVLPEKHTRCHVGQSVYIGTAVEVQIVAIRGVQVQVRVIADRSLPVHRDEVYRRIQDERAMAAHRAASQRPPREQTQEA